MSIYHALSDKAATNIVAAGMTGSPLWLPALKQTSEIAGYLVPILGAAWLIIQIGAWAVKKWRGP